MQYQLRVIRDGSAPSNIALDAANEQEARSHALQQGYTVLKIMPAGKRFLIGKERFPLVLFCQELRVLLEAGLSLAEVEALTRGDQGL